MKWLLLLVVIAGVAGYFTRPDEAKMRSAADALLGNPQSISQGVESLGATLAGDRSYDNYYVAAKYTVNVNSSPVVTCYGAFTQVKCDRAANTATSGG
jgi:hypothetical protein